MSTAQPRSLETLKNKTTQYEVVLVVNGGIVDTLAFSARKTKSFLTTLILGNKGIMSYLTDADYDASATYTKHCYSFGVDGRIQVKFSGRTERQCVLEGFLH